MRVIDLTTKRTLAVFPRPEETLDEGETADAWDSSGEDLTCTLNLNTLRMVNAARHMIRVPVLFVLGDTDTPRTLYFCDQYTVEYWPERIGDDVPYDLDKWPKKIDDWTALVAGWTAQMATWGTALAGKQDAISDLDAIRAGAAKGATAIQSHQDISGKVDKTDLYNDATAQSPKIKAALLPSYVDDVLEYASLSAFPATGEEGKIYVAKDENKTYRWSGTQYVQIGGSDITVDSALSTTSENPVQNKVVTKALNVRPTKEQIDAGWWSEWTILRDGVDVTAQVQQPEYVSDGGGASWIVDVVPTEERALLPSEDDADASELTWKGVDVSEVFHDYTATRHRVAAPVPTKTSDLTNDGSDGEHPFLTGHQTWSDVKPSGGIPKTDLASAVQTSLGKADTALQSHQSLAGLMPMYALGEEPTMTQTDWAFSGDSPPDGYHWTVYYEEGAWILEYVSNTDPSDHGNADITQSEESVSTVVFSAEVDVTATRGYVCTVSPYTSATYTATSTQAAFEIAVGALPTGVTGKVRDCVLVIDCTASGAVAPTVTWPANFHPRTDAETDFACEAEKRNVYYISEYAPASGNTPAQFVVGGWQETDNASGTTVNEPSAEVSE